MCNTLVRHFLISHNTGDTIIEDEFDPSKEWTNLGKDTFTNLGSHTMDVGTVDPNTVEAVTCIQYLYICLKSGH